MVTQWMMLFSFSWYSVSATAGHLVVFFSNKTKVLVKPDQEIESVFWKKKYNQILMCKFDN